MRGPHRPRIRVAALRHRGVFEFPRGSGVWWINYYDQDHKRHREKVGDKKDALDAYHLRKTEIRLGRFFPPRRDSIRFGELVTEALAEKEGRLTPRSYQGEKERADRLKSGRSDIPAGSVTPAKIEEWLGDLRKTGISGSTLNRYRTTLSGIFTYAVRSGRLASNPVRQVRRFKENEHRIRYLTEDEEKGLRKAIRKSCRQREPELDLALNTGMRRGEQFSLTWDAVDLIGGRLTVRGKTGRRFIPINGAAKAALERLHARSNGSAYVCPETKSPWQRDWRRWFESAVDAAKIENFRWHDLRHTFASRLVMAGVDIRTVQELMGHRSIVMTMRYSHLAPSHLQEAVSRLEWASKQPPALASPRKKVLKMR